MKLYKKILLFIISFCLLISIFNFSYAADETTIYIGTISKYNKTNEIEVTLMIENPNSDITSFKYNLSYNSDALKYENYEQSTDTINISNVKDSSSNVTATVNAPSGLNVTGEFCTIKFNVINSENPTAFNITVSDVKTTSGATNLLSTPTKELNYNINKTTKNANGQKISDFTKDNNDKTIEDIVTDDGKITKTDDDKLKYDVEDETIISIDDTGKIVPHTDGTTDINVSLNGEGIGTVTVTVENDEVSSITGSSKVTTVEENNDNSDQNTVNENTTTQTTTNTVSNTTNINNLLDPNYKNGVGNSSIFIIVLFIIIIIILFFVFKTNKRKIQSFTNKTFKKKEKSSSKKETKESKESEDNKEEK